MDGFTFFLFTEDTFCVQCPSLHQTRKGPSKIRKKGSFWNGAWFPGTGTVEQHYAQDEAILCQARR